MITMKKMALYFFTAIFSFTVIIANIQSVGYDFSTDLILALVFVYEAVLLIMALIKSGKVRKNYDPQHLKSARKLLGAAETVYVVILLNMLICFPRVVAFFGNAANDPLRALKNALFFPWLYDYLVPKTGFVEPSNMAFAWILSFTVATTVLMYIAISKFYKAKKLAIFLENRPKKKQQGNMFQTNTDVEDASIPEKQTELFEEFSEADFIPNKEIDFIPNEEADLVPDEEEFKRHLHQISDLNAADSRTDKEQRECPLCGSINNAEDKQCSFCGAELEQ